MNRTDASVSRFGDFATEALRRGDVAGARTLFEAWLARDPGNLDAITGLARACRALGDDGEMAAADRLLARSPGHLGALLIKADHFARIGDGRAAHAFYAGVVRNAPPAHTLPLPVRAEVDRARSRAEQLSRAFAVHLEGSVRSLAQSRRFARSVELLLGRQSLHLQQPTSYYFPELPNRAFYEREEFGWTDALEQKTADIRSELIALMNEEGLFRPYVEDDPSRPPGEFGALKNNPDWSAYKLIEGGRPVPEAIARCPRTMDALSHVPLTDASGRTPSVLFSLLRPGARVHPHHGQINARLICHLPIIVPEGCALRVGAEVRPWVIGETLIFDDSIEHEAWNDSTQARVVLIFEIWKPELSPEERAAVASLLSAVGDFSG